MAVATSKSEMGDAEIKCRNRASEIMKTSSTHEAHTLTPSELSTTERQMERSAALCCARGSHRCTPPKASSSCANALIVFRKECAHSLVGSACGSSRALEVMRKVLGTDPDSRSTAGSRELVAAGSRNRVPPLVAAAAHSRFATPSASATAAACPAHAEYISPRLIRGVCWDPAAPAGLSTIELRTELERSPAAASCAPTSGSTHW